jgi:ferrous iron transport protein B
VLAPLVAFTLKRTLLRGEAPIFVMEMPLYKVPSWRIIARRAYDGGWMFVRRAGTLILASMVVIWALLYFPSTDAGGRSYEARAAELADPGDQDALQSEWKANSYLGRTGRFIEPAVEPLGWDWRIGLAALASFPAREVMVGTLGILFNQGEGKSDDQEYRQRIGEAMHADFGVPVALSVMVFFALCCQCASTLVVIRRETNSWRWPAFTFTYMTVLAYVGALVTYQLGRICF